MTDTLPWATEGANFAEASHCDCPDPCACYAGGSAAGKDKAYFEIEMALQDDTHAVGCGCQPCRIKQTVLETEKLASSSPALGVMTTGTEGAHVQSVSRGTVPLLPETTEEANTTLDAVDVVADAKAEALSWSPNTGWAYVMGWKQFTSWCIEMGCAGLPSDLTTLGRYLEHLVETGGRTLATARLRLATIAGAYRLGRYDDPTSRPVVKATLQRLDREYGNPRKLAKGLTSEALAAVKGTARIQRVHKGRRRRKETEAQAAMRAAVDLALLEVMRDGLLRGSEASALRWGELEFHPDGSGRLHVARSKTDQTAEGTVLYLGPAAVDALLTIRPHEAVIAPGARVFGCRPTIPSGGSRRPPR